MSETPIENKPIIADIIEKKDLTLSKETMEYMFEMLEKEKKNKPKPFSVNFLIGYLNTPFTFLFYPFQRMKSPSTYLLETTPYYKKIWWFIILIGFAYFIYSSIDIKGLYSNYVLVVFFIWIMMFVVMLYFLNINQKKLIYTYNMV